VRVLVAPDSFTGTLSAQEAADAIADGWSRGAPTDEVTCVPLDRAVDAVADADLVVTGEGSFEFRSLSDTPLARLALAAAGAGVPCLVVAGQVHVGGRTAMEGGVHGAYAAAADVGSVEAALADPVGTLTRLAEGVARHWGGR